MATIKPFVLFDSAVYSATQSASASNYGNAGVHVIINVTSLEAGTPEITPVIQAWDPASQAWYNILTGSAINTVTRNVLKVGRGIAGVANAAAADGLPKTWRVEIQHTDAQDIEYSVGFNYLA